MSTICGHLCLCHEYPLHSATKPLASAPLGSYAGGISLASVEPAMTPEIMPKKIESGVLLVHAKRKRLLPKKKGGLEPKGDEVPESSKVYGKDWQVPPLKWKNKS